MLVDKCARLPENNVAYPINQPVLFRHRYKQIRRKDAALFVPDATQRLGGNRLSGNAVHDRLEEYLNALPIYRLLKGAKDIHFFVQLLDAPGVQLNVMRGRGIGSAHQLQGDTQVVDDPVRAVQAGLGLDLGKSDLKVYRSGSRGPLPAEALGDLAADGLPVKVLLPQQREAPSSEIERHTVWKCLTQVEVDLGYGLIDLPAPVYVALIGVIPHDKTQYVIIWAMDGLLQRHQESAHVEGLSPLR